MTDDLIKNRLSQLSPEYRNIVTSDYSDMVIDTVAQKFDLSPEQTSILDNGLWLYFLFFIDEAELKDFIAEECEVDENTAKNIAGDVMSSIPPDLKKVIDLTYQVIKNQPQTSDPEIISPVRTMAGDAANTKEGYGTNAQLPDWSNEIKDADSVLEEISAEASSDDSNPDGPVVRSIGQDEILKRMQIKE